MNAIHTVSTKDMPSLTFLISTSIIVSIVTGIITSMLVSAVLTSALQTEFARAVAVAEEQVSDSPGIITAQSSPGRTEMVPRPAPAPTPDPDRGTPLATPGPESSAYQTPKPTGLPTPEPVAAPTAAELISPTDVRSVTGR